MGLESDRDAARRRCATDRPSILASARSSSDAGVRNKAPFVGNLTWKALQRAGTYLDDQERELIMSIVGTVIFYPEDAARDPEPIAPTITSISQLLYGQATGTGTNVTQHLLRCNDYANCDVVTLNTGYTSTPFTALVENMMRSIADKIATRTAIANNSAEVGFVNQTTEPVYKMLSIGASIPGSGLSDSLIAQYRDVIAADYAYVFLERNLRLGMAALDRDYLLQQGQREQAIVVRQRAQAVLQQIAQEKNALYQKVGSFRAVSSHLEQLERQLRSSMPQHVMDMLGHRAAYLAR
jgi:conjugative transfer pilus assembly protein TraH